MEIVTIRINCPAQEQKIVTATRTSTQLLDPESNVTFIVVRSRSLDFPLKRKCFFLHCINCIAIYVLFPFFSDEEQQDVDTQVLFEFAQELETRCVMNSLFPLELSISSKAGSHETKGTDQHVKLLNVFITKFSQLACKTLLRKLCVIISK